VEAFPGTSFSLSLRVSPIQACSYDADIRSRCVQVVVAVRSVIVVAVLGGGVVTCFELSHAIFVASCLVKINQRCFYAPHLKVITAESLGVVQMHASEAGPIQMPV
jgi:hypothetical protein